MFSIHQGDALAVLRTMPEESVHCCITSPPYWGLRDYGTAKWEGGDPGCDHSAVRRGHGDEKQSTSAGTSRDPIRGGDCRLCGAVRVDCQLGLEPTPEEYVASMAEAFREVRRVLRPDGTCWVNLGDSYAGSWGNQGRKEERGTQRPINSPMMQQFYGGQNAQVVGNSAGPDSDLSTDSSRYPDRSNTGSWVNEHPTLKPKDLVGIPWRVAFALQADGWYLRSDIIWHKPNPMPESVTDRPTKAHEYLFLLAKSERYWYDADAIAERSLVGWNGSKFDDPRDLEVRPTTGRNRWQERKELGEGSRRGFSQNAPAGCHRVGGGETRNRRTVWTVATHPFSEAHFATFPPALIEPCILAGCPEGGTVLDPFTGSGTTGMVALRHGRSFVGIELNPEYVTMARNRIFNDAPLLNQEASA